MYFPAHKTALINQSKVPNGHSAKMNGTLDDTVALKLIEIIRSKSDIWKRIMSTVLIVL